MIELKKLLLKDVMVPKPFTVGMNESVNTVWEIFYSRGIRHLPVLDDKRVLKGIITLRDLYRTVSPKKTLEGDTFYDKYDLDRYILKHIMIKDVITLASTDTIGKAIDIMVNRKYGCIPIVDKDTKLLGIVTHIDILRKVAPYFI